MAPCLVSRVLQTPEMATEAAAGKPAKGRVSEPVDMGVGHELSAVTDHGTVALEPLLQAFRNCSTQIMPLPPLEMQVLQKAILMRRSEQFVLRLQRQIKFMHKNTLSETSGTAS